MFRYNLEAIKRNCKYDITSTYKAISSVSGIPIKEWGIVNKESKKVVPGDSYILNLKGLLDDNYSSIEDKLQYIDLAGKRNLFDYRMNGVSTLDALLVNTETIKHNKLLNVVDNKIHFKFEENNSGVKF